jgi:hypothetical protein
MESREDQVDNLEQEKTDSGTDLWKSVPDTTVQMDAVAQQELVDTITSVSSANNQDITKKTALSKLDVIYVMKPKYLHYNEWLNEGAGNESRHDWMSCLADWTEHAKPLPGVPDFERENREVMKTIADRPELFKIITPINVDQFEELLKTHPNCPFVESVC